MLGIVIIILLIFSDNSDSLASNSFNLSASALTCFLTSSASSFFPWPINAPICFESLFLLALSSSASAWVARAWASSSITSSTNGSFLSWNLFLIFCLTISGFSLTNFKSNISLSIPCINYLFDIMHLLIIYVNICIKHFINLWSYAGIS